jgi:hypothetical protein
LRSPGQGNQLFDFEQRRGGAAGCFIRIILNEAADVSAHDQRFQGEHRYGFTADVSGGSDNRGLVHHDILSLRRNFRLRFSEIWTGRSLPGRRRGVLCRHRDRSWLLHGAEAHAARAAETAKSGVQTALADPVLVAAGIQVIRAVGVKRLIPILALGGLALGLLARRNTSSDEAPAE